MEQHAAAPINTMISIISAIVAIAMTDIQTFTSITAGCVAIIAGLMAARHNYYATKKLKEKEIEK